MNDTEPKSNIECAHCGKFVYLGQMKIWYHVGGALCCGRSNRALPVNPPPQPEGELTRLKAPVSGDLAERPQFKGFINVYIGDTERWMDAAQSLYAAAQARIAVLEAKANEYLTLLKAAGLAINELTAIVNVTLPGIQAEHAGLTAKYTIAQAEIDHLRGVLNVRNI